MDVEHRATGHHLHFFFRDVIVGQSDDVDLVKEVFRVEVSFLYLTFFVVSVKRIVRKNAELTHFLQVSLIPLFSLYIQKD